MEFIQHHIVFGSLINFLHLSAAILWIGGLYFFLVVIPKGFNEAPSSLAAGYHYIFNAFRPYIWTSMIILLLTGGLKIKSGTFHTLSLYSIVLSVKLVLFFIMACLALYITLKLFPKIKIASSAGSLSVEENKKLSLKMKKLAYTGLIIGFGIIICVAILHL